jgi:hypothetical protein
VTTASSTVRVVVGIFPAGSCTPSMTALRTFAVDAGGGSHSSGMEIVLTRAAMQRDSSSS